MNDDDFAFALFQALNGGNFTGTPLRIGRIPDTLSKELGWATRDVYLSVKDAQKIRHHPMHGMDSKLAMHLPVTITNGDYYQLTNRATDLQLEIVLHEPESPRRAYYLV